MNIVLLCSIGLAPFVDATSWEGCAAQVTSCWEKRKCLLADYNAYDPPPNMQYGQPLTVFFGLRVNKADFDVQTSDLRLDAWVYLDWKDDRLQYDADQLFGNRSSGDDGEAYLPLPVWNGDERNIWMPDITLMDGTRVSDSGISDDTAQVFPRKEGWNVHLGRRGTLHIHCDPQLETFPFEIINCNATFESWGLSTKFLNLVVDDTGEYEQLNIPRGNQYRFDTLSFQTRSKPTASGAFGVVEVHLGLHRFPSHHITNTVIPSLLIVILTYFGFFLPLNAEGNGSGERLGYLITLFLTIIALMCFTAEQRPTVQSTTWLDKWQNTCLLLTMVPVVETAIICWCANSQVILPLCPSWQAVDLDRWFRYLYPIFIVCLLGGRIGLLFDNWGKINSDPQRWLVYLLLLQLCLLIYGLVAIGIKAKRMCWGTASDAQIIGRY